MKYSGQTMHHSSTIPTMRLIFSFSPSRISSSSARYENFFAMAAKPSIAYKYAATLSPTTLYSLSTTKRFASDIKQIVTDPENSRNLQNYRISKEEFEGIERDHSIIKIIVGIVVLMLSFFITVALIYLVRTCKSKILSLLSHTLGCSLVDSYRPTLQINKKGYGGHFGGGYNPPVTVELPLTDDSSPIKTRSIKSPKAHPRFVNKLSQNSDHVDVYATKDDNMANVEAKGWDKIFAMKDRLAELAALEGK
ncbi:unnamed protein product [Gordionus sp. m RMFG-2023]